ncbi:hypothetical protein D521_1618 [beta proteobacterium CB]|nr:hypothetical protein D521_1618 [beta proteobacterium CB]
MHKFIIPFFALLVFASQAYASGVGADIATTISAVKAAGVAKDLANPIANMVAVPCCIDGLKSRSIAVIG